MSRENKKTILLVEDEVLIAITEKMSLEKYGYTIITASNGEKAIDIIKKTPGINLILMDINLGSGIDGTEAAEQILKNHDLPVVFLSSHTESEIVEKTEKITSYGYVVKSSSLTVLDASIKMAFKLFEANKQILNSKEKLKSMISNISDVIGIIGLDGIIKYKSPNIEKWFGWQPQDLVGTDAWLTVHPDDLERIQKAFSTLLEKDNSSTTVEYNYTCKNGNYKLIELTATNLTNDPIISGVLLNYHDITERKLTEMKLQASEVQKNVILNGIASNIAFVDKDLKIIWVNKTAASSVKKSPNEMVGHTCHHFWADPSRPCENCPTIKALFTKKSEHVNMKTPDGRIWDESAEPIFDSEGNVIGAVEIATDITEQKQKEEALRESEEKYRVLHENSGIGIGYYKPDGTVISYNRLAASHMDGLPEDFIGKSIYEIFPKQEAEFYFTRIINATLSDYPVVYEDLVPLPLGNKYFLSTFTKITDSHNAILGIQILSQDITERKRVEDKINALLAEKELILKEVHHRIRNNMNTIGGLLHLQASTLKDPSAIAALNDADSRVHSMMMLYEKLYQSVSFNDVSVKDYFPALVDQIIGNFPNSTLVNIEKHVDDFMIDAKRLSSLGIIINELLTNIMKYAFTGRSAGLITVSASLKGNRVCFVIADNGNGLPESIDFENSTGFGLMLVKMLTKQIGGSIRIERENGTRIILEFEK